MSEPEVEWYVERIREMLAEIAHLSYEQMTNSKREIIQHNTNEIEIKLHTIIRKLRDETRQSQSTNKTSEQ